MEETYFSAMETRGIALEIVRGFGWLFGTNRSAQSCLDHAREDLLHPEYGRSLIRFVQPIICLSLPFERANSGGHGDLTLKEHVKMLK